MFIDKLMLSDRGNLTYVCIVGQNLYSNSSNDKKNQASIYIYIYNKVTKDRRIILLNPLANFSVPNLFSPERNFRATSAPNLAYNKAVGARTNPILRFTHSSRR